MKRDLDRIRELLLDCENSDHQSFKLEAGRSKSDIYQIEKMAEAGLVEIHDPSAQRSIPRDFGFATYSIKRFAVTWAGHDYLDAIRDDEIWNKTKKVIATEGGSMTLDLVKSLAVGFVKTKLEKHTGMSL